MFREKGNYTIKYYFMKATWSHCAGDLQSWEIGDGKNMSVVTIYRINFKAVEIEQKVGVWRVVFVGFFCLFLKSSVDEFDMEGKSRIKKPCRLRVDSCWWAPEKYILIIDGGSAITSKYLHKIRRWQCAEPKGAVS